MHRQGGPSEGPCSLVLQDPKYYLREIKVESCLYKISSKTQGVKGRSDLDAKFCEENIQSVESIFFNYNPGFKLLNFASSNIPYKYISGNFSRQN